MRTMRIPFFFLPLVVACSQSQTPNTPAKPRSEGGAESKAQIGRFGFDETGMNRKVGPAHDFYEFANGTWARNTPIPEDRSNYGMFTLLDDLSNQRTREIIEDAAKTPGSKIGDFYMSFLDEAAIEAAGKAPLEPWLAKIKEVKTRGDFVRVAVELRRAGVSNTPFSLYITQDDKAPENYIPGMFQAGINLPDRDYYLKDDEQLKAVRAAYQQYLVELFTLIGEPNAEARVKAVYDLEAAFAQVHWTRIDSRDSTKTYNKWQRGDFKKKAPGFAWDVFFAASGTEKQPAYLVAQPSAFAGMAKIIGKTPVAVLKDYLLLNAADGAAPFLSKAFVDAHFAFHDKVLSGTPAIEPRWKRGVNLVESALGEEVGKIYVAKYFPPEAKAEADRLVKNVIAAMDARLDKLEWMAPETRAEARAKLGSFTAKIGYPDKWRDYSTLEISRNDLFGNVARSSEFEWQRQLNKLGKPIDRTEWGMTPMTINAYANPLMNEIVFPAAILQPPFFDPHADPAVNYGGIGAVIGHEISHHFDDQGRKYDKRGALTDWWKKEDVERFEALTKQLVDQYDRYEALPGKKVQGQLTLGENIADLAGLTVAFDAYQMSLGGQPAKVIDGYTGEQRFYLGWAQVWRRNYREANLLQRLLTDPHSPSIQRVWVVRNLDPWYRAFQPEPGQKMFLSEKERVRIW